MIVAGRPMRAADFQDIGRGRLMTAVIAAFLMLASHFGGTLLDSPRFLGAGKKYSPTKKRLLFRC